MDKDMLAPAVALCCLAFLVGIFATVVWWGPLAIAIFGLTLSYGRFLLPQIRWPLPFAWRRSPGARAWLVATALALLACGYGHWRVPSPGPQDISHRVNPRAATTEVIVTGKVITYPRQTRSQKRQFQLQTHRLQTAEQIQPVTGKLYVTVPPEQAETLTPSQIVEITGSLYRPQSAALPRGFDFAAYLSRHHIFAGLVGQDLQVLQPGSTLGLWAIRKRVIHAQQQRLGQPAGALVSAMVLGARAVDLPADLRDQFTQVGLAHALAASGFHVSLILALILAVTAPLRDHYRATVGVCILLVFGALSGFSPSVSRAVLMGIASLLALVRDRKTRPVRILLGVAVFLLLINPMWAWDWGFQYSFLATFGLLITLQPLLARLDWLPPLIATMMAVPLAATVWTLPLQLYYGGWVPVYGLVANILAPVLLSILTLGGFLSGVLAVVWPGLGGLAAWGLYYPAYGLMALIRGIAALPGSTVALGTLSLGQMGLLYAGLLVIWQWPDGRKFWPWFVGLALLLVLLPIGYQQTHRFQVTALENYYPPIVLIQQPGGTVLINTGNPTQTRLTVVPWLQRQGINRIDLAIATASWPSLQQGWQVLGRQLEITTFSSRAGPDADAFRQALAPLNPASILKPLQTQQTITLDRVAIALRRTRPAILDLHLDQKHWLLVQGSRRSNQSAWLTSQPAPSNLDALWWFGCGLTAPVLTHLQPRTVLSTPCDRNQETIEQLQTQFPNIDWYHGQQAIQWTPQQGISSLIPPSEHSD